MNTPIADFVREYEKKDVVRLHMPGHKGRPVLGCESLDITEVKGADTLYEADGIIAQSEKNASELFGTAATFYSTEGSSQCIRAMLYLAVRCGRDKDRPVVVAARNVHKAFIYAAILLDLEIVWLWPEKTEHLCSCRILPEQVQKALQEAAGPVAAVYLTSPDYLGGQADIAAIAEVCHAHGTLLAVDNAHGAYLHFLPEPLHPLDLGADICCDSAHKTLPVLTGGAYLHISKNAPKGLWEQAKQALALFGSTSPSYLTLASLDLCNRYLADGYRERLEEFTLRLQGLRDELRHLGWQLLQTDPLRITIEAPQGMSGKELADRLRERRVECEYADMDFCVLMLTPENSAEDLEQLVTAIGRNEFPYEKKEPVFFEAEHEAIQEMLLREAYFSKGEELFVEQAGNRICRVPTAACPPGVPVVVPGERLSKNRIQMLRYYEIDKIEVVVEN